MIDPELRDLCRMLHDVGIHTTPSCQGHFYGREYFEEVWAELEREEDMIRSVGLPVIDSASGRELNFRAVTFQLPWANFKEFYAQAGAHQTEGYLGMLLPRDRHNLVCRLHNQPYRNNYAWLRFDGELSVLLGGSLFSVTIRPHDPGHRGELWRAITEYVRVCLAEDAEDRSAYDWRSAARSTRSSRRPN